MANYRLISYFVIIVILVGLAIITTESFKNYKLSDQKPLDNPNSGINKYDTQYIEIKAKGGYSPSLIEAKSNQNTILKVSTNNTFDCSASLSIPKIGYQQMLPISGEVQIELGVFKSGDEINGTCMMGMYGFKIKFI